MESVMKKEVVLRTVDLMKTYLQGERWIYAVNRVSVEIYNHEFTAIVGASGSGKSTFLHLCGGIDVPSGGEVHVTDVNGKTTNLYALSAGKLTDYRAENFGFVFQNFALLPVLTAKENIMVPSIYGRSELDKDYMTYLCEKLRIADKLDHLPSELSGGEQQRVAVARALVGRPQIVFADEPTGNLDKASSAEVVELFMSLCREEKRTVIVVTHDMSIAALADRTLHMDDGQLFSEEKERMSRDQYEF